MDLEPDFPKNQPTEEEVRKREALRQSHRMYYLRNRHWLLEEARKKRAKERRRRRKLAKANPPPPKPVKHVPTPEEREARKQARLEAAQKAREEWAEIGWVIAKMNKEGGLTQRQIYDLLGGMVARKKIAHYCARGRKLAKIKPPQ